ncbi:sigma-70 family RNA polymerase sigma factor [Mucilaginibacter sp. BJC16-A38]|uniref:sigma-70 family RNA polymerase sigma factor n=1 Tax=Mucilaginibacter phenanthrenivorans TaxID=1234842 RepID=UPI002158799F|nr:sigma-70 family RNA polymerase sigma factor [Mucilaginibacter phenanthrenivorans]MCR8559206.1 sigma-70 family RNA polymerase sigma factor [Mucilaginibacter phenanthrenivorans]
MDHQLHPHKWVTAHADYLYNFAITRINDDELAKDLVQETFLAALQKVEGFAGKSSERTWLTAILKNKIIDTYRKKSSGLRTSDIREAEDEQSDFFNADDGHWINNCPKEFGIEDKDALVSKEFERIMQRCLQKLPALWMSVFTMKHIDEEPTETICTELRVTQANFWVIIHRAKLNLRACLQKNWI